MNTNANITAIGIGALFPIQLSSNSSGKTGWYPAYGDPQLIEDNIKAIILYEIGQRLRQEDFGTLLTSVLEEPNTLALTFLIRKYLKDAFDKYESRISIKKISATHQSAKIYMLIEYTIEDLNKESFIEAQYNL